MWALLGLPRFGGATHANGDDLDIAKSVFQVHGIDAAGNVIIRRQLKRRYVLAFFQKLPPCLIAEPAMQAGGSTIYLASGRCWRLPWLPASLTRRHSGQEGTSRPGSAGVEFIDENGGGPGVRLRKREQKKGSRRE
jgi:hypothetical protein